MYSFIIILFAVQLLTPALVNFNRRFKLEFDNIWTGAYCTFAREKAEGNIYVFGLNNYNQLGKFLFFYFVVCFISIIDIVVVQYPL